jgi:transcriptional regulator with XRE-family HTH domain
MTTSAVCQVGLTGYYCLKGHFFNMIRIRDVLAVNLKEYRRKRGMTQEELAEKAEVSTHYIAMIETCKKYPKPEMLEHIAQTLEIEPYKLFSVISDPNEPFERLHQAIITDMKQVVNEAVEKVIDRI